MATRKLTMTWIELEEILRKAGVLFKKEGLRKEEEIKDITLIHPRELIIYTEGG